MLTARELEKLLPEFISHLTASTSSRSTIKNYASDLRRLISKLDQYKEIDSSDLVQALDELGTDFSESTIRRFGFSLKAFQSWLSQKGITIKQADAFPSQTVSKTITQAPVEDYVSKLAKEGAHPKTVHHYRNDLSHFFGWLRPGKTLETVDKGTINKVKAFDIKRYISFQKSRQVSDATINRQLYSLKSFFAHQKEKITYDNNPVQPETGKTGQGFWSRFKLKKPRVWHAYRGHPISDYVNWAAMAVITLIIGLNVFGHYFVPSETKIDVNELKGLVLAASPPQILSFQGRLTNNVGAPITSSTTVVFKIYDAESGGTLKWTSKDWEVVPDANGIFSACLGNTTTTDDCLIDGVADTAFPANLFADNAALYLDITVEGETLTPRQRIASSSYALNSDSLDGIDSLSFLRSDTSDNFTSGTLTTDAGTTLDVNGTLAWGGATISEALAMNGQNITGIGTSLTAAAGVTLSTTTTGALTLDSGTTGNVNLGTGNNAKTIAIGNGNAGNTINIGTNNTVSDSINIGSALDNVAITGDDWSVTAAGVLTVASCSGCGGGGFSGEVDDTTNDSLTFTSDDGSPPAGTVNSIYRDNTGDLNINVISGKILDLKIAGSDEYNISSTGIAFNSNNITGFGTALTAAAGLSITTTTSSALTLDSGTTGNVNLGTGNNAKTIAIGTGNAGNTFNIGTDNTISDTINIGSALDNVAITGDQWSITNAGVLTVVSCSGCGGGSQTPWTSDIDADGWSLLDFGTNLTARGAITVTSTGASNDIVLNSADLIELQDSTSITAVNSANSGLNALTLSGNLAAFDNSDTFRGIFIDYTNADHNGSSNFFYGVDIDGITADGQATERAINIGNGWDAGIAIGNSTTGIQFTGSTYSNGVSINSSAINIGTGYFVGATSAGSTQTVTTGFHYSTLASAFGSASGTTAFFAEIQCGSCGAETNTLTNGFRLSATGAGASVTNGLFIESSDSAYIRNAINIDNTNSITTSNPELALNIGAGWDAALSSPFGGLGFFANSLIYSEQLDNSTGWTATSVTVAANTTDTLDPINTNTAEKLTSTASPGYVQQDCVCTLINYDNTTWTLSAWVKSASAVTAKFEILETGGSTAVSSSVNVTTEWQRVWVTGTYGTGTTNTARIRIHPNNSGSGNVIYVWGVQFESNGEPTTYSINRGSANSATGVRGLNTDVIRSSQLAVGGTPFLHMGASLKPDVAMIFNLGYGLQNIPNITATGGGTDNFYTTYIGNPTLNTGVTAPENVYGLYLEPMTRGSISNYGICFDCDGTFGTTTVATGIQWGTDVSAAQLFRSGANTLSLGTTTTLTAATTLTINSTGNSALNLDSTSGGTINIGSSNSSSKIINIGTGTGANTINIGTGSTSADTISLGNASVETTFAFSSTVSNTTAATLWFGALTSGIGLDVLNDAQSLSSGNVARFCLNCNFGALSAQTVSGNNVLIHETWDNASGTSTRSGFNLEVRRELFESTGTLSVTGAVAYFNSSTPFGSSPNDSANILHLNQGYASATGAVLQIQNSGTGPSIDLTTDTTPSIQMVNNSALSITDGTNTLFQFKDMSTNFGGLALAGAWASRNMYWGEEYNSFRAQCTAETVQSRGDAGNKTCAATSGDISTTVVGTGTCTFRSGTDGTNGFEQINTADGAGDLSCGEYIGQAANDAHLIFNSNNLPTAQFKVRPSRAATGDTNTRYFVGLGNIGTAGSGASTDAQTIMDSTNDTGIYFSNCTAPQTASTCNDSTWNASVQVAGSAPVTVDCGVSISTSQFAYMRIEVVSAGGSAISARAYVDGNVSDGISETQCPAWGSPPTINGVQWGFFVNTVALNAFGSNYNFDIDYIRIWQDDAAIVETSPDLGDTPPPLEEDSKASQRIATETAELMNENLSDDLADKIFSSAQTYWNNSTGQLSAWVNSQGEAFFVKVTSLIGDFRKLIFGELVVKEGSQVAGEGSFEEGATEVFITSDKISDSSLINLTPTTKTDGLSLYIKEKRTGEGFVVALEENTTQLSEASTSAKRKIQFTWFILNKEE